MEKRTLRALAPVLKEPASEANPERVVYEVYREAEPEKDQDIIKDKNIRYDITKIHPGRLGRELPKTFGHYHRPKEAEEIFKVISGRAMFLIQKYEARPEIIKEVYLIEAGENEKIIVPPGFGIVSVNPEKTELVLANWIGREVKNDYQFYEKLRGACYYLTENEKGEIIFEKNPHYKKVPALVKLKPKDVKPRW